jgi:plastocyanin
MEKTTRRNLLKAAAVGGVAATGLGAIVGSNKALALSRTARAPEGGEAEHEHAQDQQRPLSGRRAHATVAFGQWDATGPPPLDRHPLNSPINRNVHKMLPFEAEIDVGGAVSFLISGVHQILIYDDGTELADVREILPEGSILVDDPHNRIYRGLNPQALFYAPAPGTTANVGVRDRVEVVNFARPGRFLVVCGVVFHFREGMHGFINVKERDDA